MVCKQCNRENPTKILHPILGICHSCNVKNWNKNNFILNRMYHRNYDQSEKGKDKKRERDKLQRLKFPEKIKARNKLFWAVKSNKIKKKPCHCGIKKVEAHHPTYSKPLEVLWLCLKHHRVLHGQYIY